MSKERRRHKLYITRNTEYHFRDDECVGVKDLQTGKWKRWHRALRGRLIGFMDRKHETFEKPVRGGRLHLVSAGSTRTFHVLTSPLVQIKRPKRQDPGWYISNCWAGEIYAAAVG